LSTPATIPSPSPQAFAQAHSALAAWIRRRLTDATGDPHVAEDLAQQTWQAVWEAVSQGRYDPSRAALSTFAYAVSQNVYRHWLRRQSTAAAHAPAVLANAPQMPEPENNPLADAELIDELRRVLREGGAGLSEESLQTLHLIARGSTDRELALELAVAPSTAHARKRAALNALRTHLTSRFFSERTPPQR
jgi:RNA polymerase sigma factor (sigma-70 family)